MSPPGESQGAEGRLVDKLLAEEAEEGAAATLLLENLWHVAMAHRYKTQRTCGCLVCCYLGERGF